MLRHWLESALSAKAALLRQPAVLRADAQGLPVSAHASTRPNRAN
jgi:hypothetical protein